MRYKHCVFMVLLAFGCAAAWAQAQQTPEKEPIEVDADRMPGEFDAEALRQERAYFFDMLTEERASFHGKTHMTLQPSGEQLRRLANERLDNPRLLVGVDLPTDHAVRFTNAGERAKAGEIEHGGGALALMEDGGYSWTFTVQSRGASALRIHLEHMELAEGVELFFYTDLGEVDGPYTGLGPNRNGVLWSDALMGEQIHIQLRAYGKNTGKKRTRFQIAGVAYLGDNYQGLVPDFAPDKRAHCSYNASCILDASCYTGVSQVADARLAVARILYSSGGSQFLCSGGLIADYDTTTQRPFFLTANHCINSTSEANSAVFFWRYNTSSCNGTCGSPYASSVPRTNGANHLTSSSSSDYSLLYLNTAPPAGSVFLGWSSANVANSHNTNLYRISHPEGAPQAYSQHRVDTSKPTCTAFPRGKFIYSRNILGATEGGSSGSPVVDQNGRIRGQLYGTCGSNPTNPCDSTNNATVDGAIAAWKDILQIWLFENGSSCNSCGNNYGYCSTGCYWDCEVDGRCDANECEDICEAEYDACIYFCH